MSQFAKSWLITGITGQDGSYLAEYLLNLGYKNIHGIIRRSSTYNTKNIDGIFNKLQLHYGDLTDALNIHKIIEKVKPDYIINLGAQSHVKVSAELETYTFNVNTLGILNILQSVRSLNLNCKVYQASTSEMYGNQSGILNENTPMKPVSIYGISKKSAQELCDMYKNAFGMYVVSSILFNHESPRRGKTFVSQKIIEYVKKYKKGIKPLQLGNLDSKRDWGHARDYIKAIYQMMIQEKPDNYVIATGETHSVKEFVEEAFKLININIQWVGSGLNEKGIDSQGNVLVEVNERYYRDIEIHTLIGDYSKAKQNLNWEPKIKFKELVLDMFYN